MSNGLLLWVDDEIELLKAHIIFLEKKGYEVVTVSNGADAIDQCRQQTFDLILLDEMMPGLSGLETLQQIKDIQPATPVITLPVNKDEQQKTQEDEITLPVNKDEQQKTQEDNDTFEIQPQQKEEKTEDTGIDFEEKKPEDSGLEDEYFELDGF